VPSVIKVGFHLNNGRHPNVDLRCPEKGNPGIGGTEFTTLATAYYLKQFHSDKVEPVLLAECTDLLPENLSYCAVDSLVNAVQKASEQKLDIFVFRSQNGNNDVYRAIERHQVSAIARSNNTPDHAGLNQIAESAFIKRHVCVGQEQLDILRDHKIILKSTRIFHPFNPVSFIPDPDRIKDPNLVVYLGSITAAKGFHHLAKAWPEVLQQHPSAQLTVIGSGKLYNPASKLGQWGIAEEKYESKSIRPYLSDKQGNIHPSVCFRGVLGSEKIPILQRANIGVINPTGYTEVFPASALEIQACGSPVVAGADWGNLDTALNKKTGLLSNGHVNLVRNLVYLLKHPAVARSFGDAGIDFVRQNFSPVSSASQWMALFEEIINNKVTKAPGVKSNLFHRGKILREGIRIVRSQVPGMASMPNISELKQVLRGAQE
jgi:glycosyltransferase involved in cell wall biosynthesis